MERVFRFTRILHNRGVVITYAGFQPRNKLLRLLTSS